MLLDTVGLGMLSLQERFCYSGSLSIRSMTTLYYQYGDERLYTHPISVDAKEVKMLSLLQLPDHVLSTHIIGYVKTVLPPHS